MQHQWNEIDRGKTEVLGGKTCPSASSSTTNPTWTDPGSNTGLRGERSATDRLSHGKAKVWLPRGRQLQQRLFAPRYTEAIYHLTATLTHSLTK